MEGTGGPEYLIRPKFDAMTVVAVIVTLLLHGGVVAAIYVKRVVLVDQPPPPQAFVVARLVRLGKKRNPRKLPNKIVPQAPTKKQETVNLNADANDAPNKKKPKKPRPDRDAAIDDRMRHALEKAALMEQAQREIEAEGDPSGVVGGTATEAGEGDPYMTRIADLWNRTWSLPVIIPKDEAKRLYVLMVLRVDGQGNIQLPIEFDRSSGDPHFDNSVKAAWAQIRRVPAPPPERRASILANGLALKLTWRGIQ